MMKSILKLLWGLLLAVSCGLAFGGAPSDTPMAVDIAKQPLRDALALFARQTGLQLMLREESVPAEQHTARTVKGTLSPREALAQLLEKTSLRFEFVTDTMVRISSAQAREQANSRGVDDSPMRLAEVSPAMTSAGRLRDTDGTEEMAHAESGRSTAGSDSSGIPEMLVKGARSGNTDIRRTEDDVQPYVVFDAEEIGRSMAPDLETFLRTRLPMNQLRSSEGQNISGSGGSSRSTIDLRGLGADQTLILVNGRRMPGVATSADPYQPDINGIPISAVERIEILPSTAGGIYGGGATGGVVNVILKRNYNDLELAARYDGTFDGGGAERRLDATAGFTLEGGRTHVMIVGSYRDGNPLYIGDRSFSARAWALQDRNNHAAFRAGSTPMHGYTTNIRSRDGSDLVLKEGMVSLGSPIAHVPVGYAGPDSDDGEAFLGTADRYNLMPANDVVGSQYALLNAPTVRSLQLSVRRDFTDRVEAFVDASRYDNRTVRMGSTAMRTLVNFILPEGPDNPFDQEVRLSVPLPGYAADRIRTPFQSLSEQLSGGVIVRLPREWTVQGEYTLGRSSNTYQSPQDLLSADGEAALLDGRLDPLRDVNAYPLDFSPFYPGEGRFGYEYPMEQENATLRISGPLLRLPGGPLRLAALLERREQLTGDRVYATYPGDGMPTFTYYAEVGSGTESGYVELNAPLVSAVNARPGLLGFDLRASYRHDATKTRTRPASEGSVQVPSLDGPFPELPFQTKRGTGNQYTLGFRYMPLHSVALRLSYGEGILQPLPSQLSAFELPPMFLSGLIDPKRGELPVDTATVERYTTFGSLLLRPEQSVSWSGGVIFTPASLPGFRVSVDYTRIEKTDEIGFLDNQVLLDLEDGISGHIVRNELTAADAGLGYTGGTIRQFIGGNVNIARSLMEAFDIQVDYGWKTPFGSFDANVIATVQPHLSQRATPDSEETDSVGYSNGPLKWRANAGLRFSRGAWNLGWNMQYYDASRVYSSTASAGSRDNLILGQGSAWIPTQTYHDLYGSYRFEHARGFAGGLLQNTELRISVQNVFNTSPPILASSSAYLIAGYATEGDPRLRRYSISFTKGFGL